MPENQGTQGNPMASVDKAALIEALTPSAATKAAYIGEFSFTVLGSREDEDGEQIDYQYDVTVPWDTVKQIMKAIRDRALTATQEPVNECARG